MRLRLDISYDGTDFHGWAAQTGLRTVQSELEMWIARILRLPSVSLVCAGRTDAGVHARGQVAHLDLDFSVSSQGDGSNGLVSSEPSSRSGGPFEPSRGPQAFPDPADVATTLHQRLLRALPADLVVRRVTPAPPGFDARFSAIWRRYVYRLAESPADPLLRHMAVPTRPLDLPAVNEAATTLLGLHDFAAFSKPREGATTIRTLQRLSAERTGDGLVELTAQADAFCHSMVRSLAGALVEVGLGRRSASWLAGLLDLGCRSGEVPVLPARGLVLEEVGYPPDDELATRAAQARAIRVLPTPGTVRLACSPNATIQTN